MTPVIEALFVFAAQFLYVFLLGLQQLNVVGRHYAAAAATSWCLGVFGYYLTATIAVHSSPDSGSLVWWAFTTAGVAGICFAMWVHPRIERRFKKEVTQCSQSAK